MPKTEKQIIELKQQIQGIRDTVIQAKATMNEVIKNIEDCKNELKSLGVDPDNADEVIKEIEAEIDSLYNSSYQKIEKWSREQ
jgi:uncharacterized protein Yka (UPF0111/DUF47 family)